MHRLIAAATASIIASAATGVLAGPGSAAEVGAHYVALGDSYAAGSGVLPEEDATVCMRSQLNYPKLVAQQLHATTFHDATCGGATLTDLYDRQAALVGGGSANPQFDALTPDTTLVTMTMGGNDIGLAIKALSCINAFPPPYGRSCTEDLTANGRDEFAERLAGLAPVYAHALDDIRARAPKATVMIVGYPTVVPAGGCPQQPTWPSDIDYLRHTLDSLNDLLRTTAGQHGAVYVDTATPSVGHDICAAPDQQWINGLLPSLNTSSVAPLHPNAVGEQQLANAVVAALPA